MKSNHNCRIAEIPCLRINPSIKPVGTVLLYHGWASSIDDYSFFASMISSWGYRVIVPELPYHGERGKLNYFDRSELQQYFWPVVLKSIQEAEAITNELASTDDPIAIVGNSAGGFIAAGTLSKVSRVRSVVVINGSCAWVKCEELFREMDGRNPMSADERTSLEQHDPLTHLSIDRDKALLLLHGKTDLTIPIESQRYFMNAMSTNPISEEYLQLVEYSEVNHQVTLGMLERTKEWLDKHLAN